MKLVFVAHRGGATFEIRDVTTVVADNEGALKLSRVSRVDAEIGGEFHRTANTARNINEGTVGEDGTVERSEIIVAIGNDRAEVFAHEFRILSHGLTDGAEDDALFLQFFLEGGFDRHGVHHGINGHTRECQTLMKRDAEFVEGLHQFGVYLFAAFLLLFLGRVGIIRDGLIVDLWQVDVSPFGLLQCEPIAIGLQAEVEQPFWFAFLRGDETNDIFIEASLDDFRMDIGGEAVFVFFVGHLTHELIFLALFGAVVILFHKVCLLIPLLSNVEKITSAILPLASNILYAPLPFRLFSNLFSVTMLALLLRISSKIAQKCRCKIAELILSTLLSHYFSDFQRRKNPLPPRSIRKHQNALAISIREFARVLGLGLHVVVVEKDVGRVALGLDAIGTAV